MHYVYNRYDQCIITMNEISNEELLSRERVSSSSTSVFKSFELGIEVLGEKGYFNQESLSSGFKRIYGFDIHNKMTGFEIRTLTNNLEIFDLINQQKVFHVNGLTREFDLTKNTLIKVNSILIRRELIAGVRWDGFAKRTFGMILYMTKDCTKDDIINYLREYETVDQLRLSFEEKNPKKKTKTPEQVVEIGMKTSKLFAEAKSEGDTSDGDLLRDHCDHGVPLGQCTKRICIARREIAEMEK